MPSIPERLMRRVQHMVGVGRTTGPVDDTGPVQTVQVQTKSGNHVDKVPVPGLFGVISVMPVGSDVTYNSVSGDSSAIVGTATGHQGSRAKGNVAGSAGLHDQVGTTLLLSNDGNVTLTATGTVTFKIGTATYVFSETAFTATAGVTAGQGGADQVTLQHHTHPTAAIGGPSTPTPGT